MKRKSKTTKPSAAWTKPQLLRFIRQQQRVQASMTKLVELLQGVGTFRETYHANPGL